MNGTKKTMAAVLPLTLMLSACSGLDFSKSLNPFKEGQAKTQEHQEKIDPEKEGKEEILTLEEPFFNQIKEVNGKQTIANPENRMVLVNKEFSLPADYEPADLVSPNVPFSFGDAEVPQRYIRKEAAAALERLFAQAAAEGIELFAVSGYRSYERQTGILNVEKERKGDTTALETVALPGQSEHQTGLAMDVTSKSADMDITEKFGDTPEGKWVQANAHKFGFIIRYQKGKEEITKFSYEPWHLRYVGVKEATEIYENQLTLEEYFKKVKKI
ncbi:MULTISPECIES: D-alanyl-D-alanine carboxypeptidase family protein [Metabacillus]|uniref:Peptidase M15 n=1 Tax=Metabacillus indicus TaxID=246786 RepID=A0A084H142_METID|nr:MULTISPECIES: M15 family metallopeptidase [Metabacillus]KEZ50442.1 peptidase M15 [Metabacillus indicus LMG 22858]KEZ53304.1 peptidase M15 [Metabacillus indicus]